MPDPVRADEPVESVLLRDLLCVAEVLDYLERVPERQHLRLLNVLDRVRDRLQVAVVVEGDAICVTGLLLDVEAPRAAGSQARLDFVLMPLEPLLEVEVTGVVRVGELVPHDDLLRDRPVERKARRVGAAMFHRLEHPRHVPSDCVPAAVVLIDDSRDSAH